MPNTAGEAEGEAKPNVVGETKAENAMARTSDATSRSGPAGTTGEWQFEFHGFVRAPMRVGMGKRENPRSDQSERTFHAPIVPDDQHLSWQHTRHMEKDWAELFFSVGNPLAKLTVGIKGYNFSDAAWNDNDAQFGIAEGYVTLTPELPWQNIRLIWKVGALSNRYGGAGRYDAGEYDTYAFGRTHVLGETLRGEVDIGQTTLAVEHGIGSKRPDPSIFNDARFTLLHHAHVFASWKKTIIGGLHYLTAWTQEEDRDGSLLVNPPDGRLTTIGPEIRLNGGMFGELYLAYSQIRAHNAVTVSAAYEVLHAGGGGDFSNGVTHNYLEVPVLGADDTSGGNGRVDSIVGQYEFSLGRSLAKINDPESDFWGEGRDAVIKLYGMINMVKSDDQDADGIRKLKYGVDLMGSLFPVFGVGLRYDRVQPNNEVPEQSFGVISPRLIFRTRWVTREEITIQYTRYMYNERECDPANPLLCVQPATGPVLPDGFGATTGNQDANMRGAPLAPPDKDAFKIQATFWW
jgi:hypothetical protein